MEEIYVRTQFLLSGQYGKIQIMQMIVVSVAALVSVLYQVAKKVYFLAKVNTGQILYMFHPGLVFLTTKLE